MDKTIKFGLFNLPSRADVTQERRIFTILWKDTVCPFPPFHHYYILILLMINPFLCCDEEKKEGFMRSD